MPRAASEPWLFLINLRTRTRIYTRTSDERHNGRKHLRERQRGPRRLEHRIVGPLKQIRVLHVDSDDHARPHVFLPDALVRKRQDTRLALQLHLCRRRRRRRLCRRRFLFAVHLQESHDAGDERDAAILVFIKCL